MYTNTEMHVEQNFSVLEVQTRSLQSSWSSIGGTACSNFIFQQFCCYRASLTL